MNAGRAGRSPGRKARRERRISIKILVALAVVAASTLMVTLAAQANSARRSCSGRPLTANVAVAPEIAPAVSTVALLFNRQRHLVAGHCAEVQVTAAAPAAVAAQVDGQGPAKGLPACRRLDPGLEPVGRCRAQLPDGRPGRPAHRDRRSPARRS